MKLAVGAMGGTPSLSSSSSDRAFEYCSCSIMLYSSFVSTCTPSQVGEDHDDDGNDHDDGDDDHDGEDHDDGDDDHGRQAEDDDSDDGDDDDDHRQAGDDDGRQEDDVI